MIFFVPAEVVSNAADPQLLEAQGVNEGKVGDEIATVPLKRKKTAKETEQSKKKATKENGGSKELKFKKRSKRVKGHSSDDAS